MTASSESDNRHDVASAHAQKPPANLMQRLISGLVLMPAIFLMIFSGGWLLFFGTLALMIIAMLEFYNLVLRDSHWMQHAIGCGMGLLVMLSFQCGAGILWQIALVAGFFLGNLALIVQPGAVSRRVIIRTNLLTMAGVLYISLPAAMTLGIRAAPQGLIWLMSATIATWSVDTAAYAFGRAFGKTPLFPKISPNKTREGALGGILAGLILPWLSLHLLDPRPTTILLLVLVAPLVAIAGDTFESWVKRITRTKDLGLRYLNIMPGHGGILDRIDGLLWVLALFYGYLLLNGMVALPA